jgi:hypothetical protein
MYIKELSMKSVDSRVLKEKEEPPMTGSEELSQSHAMGNYIEGGVKKLVNAYRTSRRELF